MTKKPAPSSQWTNPPPGIALQDRIRQVAEEIAEEVIRKAKAKHDEQGLTDADKELWNGLPHQHAQNIQHLLGGYLCRHLPPDVGFRGLTLIWSHRSSDPDDRVAVDALLCANIEQGFPVEAAIEWAEEWCCEAREKAT